PHAAKVEGTHDCLSRTQVKKEELGLLMLELSARGEGYHLVFRRKTELSQEDNLRWASDLLGVKYDEGAKDITRVFFTTTGSEEDLLHLDDELFEQKACLEDTTAKRSVTGGNALGFETSNPKTCLEGTTSGSGEQGTALQAELIGGGESPSTPPSSVYPVTDRLSEAVVASSHTDYDGIPYTAIIEALENQLGGVPAHGSRNQFIFSMACHLRYICNDDPEWIAKVLPNYGEALDKWMNTIKSACNRSQNKTIPKVLMTAIEIARSTLQLPQGGESYCCGMPGTVMVNADSDSYGSSPRGGWEGGPPMPSKLPPLIKLLISKTPKIYQPAVAHAVFPALATHLWKTRFKYIDNVEHEATLMNVLMAGTGAGKNCIAEPIRHIMKDIVEHDQINREKERQWKEEMQTKGSNKDKKKRPEGLIIQNVKPDMTNAAFVQRMKEAEEHFLYTQMNEIDQFDALKTSSRSKSQFQIMCLAFDPQNSYGTERVGTASVSETVCVRFNWNASTTIQKGKAYFSKVLTDGPISRINFCTIPERPIGSEMPVYGTYDEHFQAELKPYIDRLNAARGLIECPKATALAKKLMEENADFARLSQSRVYENLSFRGNVIAFLKAMVLYVAQGEKWDKTIEDFTRWSEQYDLWCKMMFFGEAIEDAETASSTQRRPGPQNLLVFLPNEFTADELQQVRRRQGVDKTPLSHLLNVWKNRGYVEQVEGKENVWRKTLSPALSR
ncbi:MAG: hypothetical protein MJZ41_13340, partial [Bacteroidaceae bacterium]|nr:hypothetical protein [Bacteroidaceae bacterium]